jgi:hypothetical protein
MRHVLRSILVLAVFAVAMPGALRAQQAAEKELVGVIQFDIEGGSKVEASAITDRLREELLRTGRFRMVDRSQLDDVIDEIALQQTGCTSQECAVQVGRVLGIRKICAGRVVKVSADMWLVSAQMIEVETAETLRAESVTHRGMFENLLGPGVADLAARLAGAPPAAAPPPLAAPAPPAGKGHLFVESDPPGARIVLDGQEREEKTPALLTDIPVGEHVLEAARGFLQGRQTVQVRPGEVANVRLELTPAPATLVLASNPSGATVTLDGKNIGRTPLTLQTDSGTRHLQFVLQGYPIISQSVEVLPGQTNAVSVDFIAEQARIQEEERQAEEARRAEDARRAEEARSIARRESLSKCINDAELKFFLVPFGITFFLTPGLVTATIIAQERNRCQELYGLDDHEWDALFFVFNNSEAIIAEASQGRGEHLNSLAELMGCPIRSFEEFGSLAQSRFEALMPDTTMDAYDLWLNFKKEMAAHPQLSVECKYLFPGAEDGLADRAESGTVVAIMSHL